MDDSQDEIYCDVLLIDIAHILLGRPWLYDLDVTNHEKENTYVFSYKGKKIILRSTKLSEKDKSRTLKSSQQAPTIKGLHLLDLKSFVIMHYSGTQNKAIDVLSRISTILSTMSVTTRA